MEPTPLLEEIQDARSFAFVIGFAVISWLLSLVVLKKEERSAVRVSTIFLVIFIILKVVSWFALLHHDYARVARGLATFSFLVVVGRSLVLLLTHGVVRRSMGELPPRIVLDLVQGVGFIAIVLLSLDASGLKPTSLLATSAVLTAVLGLSLQETLGNLFAGLAIQGEQPFQVGDWIQFENEGGRSGRVIEINWRATKIITADRVTVVVPNGVLARAPIANFSSPEPYARRAVTVDVPYDCPAGIADILKQSAERVSGVCTHPAPDAVIVEFAESSIRYRVRFFITEHARTTEIQGAVLSNCIAALRRHDIFIPFSGRRIQLIRKTSKDIRRSEEARLRRLLKANPIVTVLAQELQDELVQECHFVRFAKNEPIVVQDEQGEELYVITHGSVRVVLENDGKATHLANLGPTDFFGEMSLLTGEPRAASIYANEETELIVVGHSALRVVLEKNPAAVDAIAPAIAKRQAELSEQLLSATTNYPPEPQNQLRERIRDFFRAK